MDPFQKKKRISKLTLKSLNAMKKQYMEGFVNFWDRPDLDEIPEIVEPTMHGMIEVMRGCGRGCKFCDVTLRSLRYYSPEKVKKEIEVNIKKGGLDRAWVHSDDIFVYGMDPTTTKKHGTQTVMLLRSYLLQLCLLVLNIQTQLMEHWQVQLQTRKLIPNLSKIINAGPSNLTGIQCGLETGSIRLIEKYADRKLAPYQPEEWHWVVKEAV